MMPIEPVDAVLNVAWSFRWVRETHGANRGEAVDEMIRLTALDPSGRYPWCAAFVAYCGYAALRDLWPLPKLAGCASLGDAALARHMLEPAPARGAIFLIFGTASDGAKRFKHTGYIRRELGAPGSGVWETIEGNTNDGGSPEGTGVFVRSRTFGPDDRFIWWWI